MGNIIQIKTKTIPRSKIYLDKYIDKIKSGTKINSKTANITESCTRLAFDNRFSSALQLLRVKIFLDSFDISPPPFCVYYSIYLRECKEKICVGTRVLALRREYPRPAGWLFHLYLVSYMDDVTK